jgi:hypothetical protein
MRKNVFIAIATAVVLSMGISSCSKCQVCTKTSEPEVRICKGDYGTETEYGFAVDVKKGQGYNCKSSI